MTPRNREIGLIVCLETLASRFGIEQCKRRKVRQIDTIVKDQRCNLAAIGEKVRCHAGAADQDDILPLHPLRAQCAKQCPSISQGS
jgi:hypothetical protein